MIVAYFPVFLHDKNGIQIDVFRQCRIFALSVSRHNFDGGLPKVRDKALLQVLIGGAHSFNALEPEFGYQPVLKGVEGAFYSAFTLSRVCKDNFDT